MNTCGALGGVIGALAILAPAAEVAANVSEAAGIGAQTEPSVYFTALTSVFPAPSVSPALQSIRRINQSARQKTIQDPTKGAIRLAPTESDSTINASSY